MPFVPPCTLMIARSFISRIYGFHLSADAKPISSVNCSDPIFLIGSRCFSIASLRVKEWQGRFRVDSTGEFA